ncbi:MAG: sugar ABC transporter permease [Oscillospiraceae bacterium]|jgi:multiple sugar transport system permease protein|nr:sugar ABC transporter permease [Oscillospiraceae bacterium]MDD3261480.1 sugar ABC transporter permease [Oscillospiraceae bacterium]
MKISQMTSTQKREWRSGIFFLLPNIGFFFLFTFIPIIVGLILSFTNYNGFNLQTMKFVGLRNFIELFQDDYFLVALRNTLVYTLVSVPLTLLCALLLALALTAPLPGKGMFKTVFYFPSITAMVAVAIVWGMMFNPTGGPINNFLTSIGVQNPPGWIVSTKWSMFSVVIVSVWKNAGYYMIMILSGLLSIPSDCYEAAKIDGAHGWKKFWYITWPLLSPTMFMVTILAVISSFQVFDLVYVMTQGGPGDSTSVLVYRIYQEGFKNMNMGYASAMAYFLFLIILIFTLIQFRSQKQTASAQ